jgi:phosphoglycolate phosphatase
MKLRAVLFDCDGVLFRSEPANIAFYNDVLALAGEPPLDGEGLGDAHALAAADLFAKRYGAGTEMARRLHELARDHDYGPYFDLMEPRRELRPALEGLRAMGLSTAMATNRGKTTGTVVERFGLGDLFDLWVGALDVARPKPAPDMLELCLERLGVGPQEAVYVGDQAGDLAAARAAGIGFIAMPPVAASSRPAIARLDELPDLLARPSLAADLARV